MCLIESCKWCWWQGCREEQDETAENHSYYKQQAQRRFFFCFSSCALICWVELPIRVKRDTLQQLEPRTITNGPLCQGPKSNLHSLLALFFVLQQLLKEIIGSTAAEFSPGRSQLYWFLFFAGKRSAGESEAKRKGGGLKEARKCSEELSETAQSGHDSSQCLTYFFMLHVVIWSIVKML